MKIARLQKNKGFTLIETLIAILILTLAISGPIYIASMAFRNTIDSRDNITAQYLAEEVVESIRNNRDARMLKSSDSAKWISDGAGGPSVTDLANCFNNAGESTNRCVMNRSAETGTYVFEQCSSSGVCPNISFDPNGAIIYGKTGVADTSKFVREFYFEKGANDTSATTIPDNEAKLVVNIKWLNKGQSKVYTLTERLYAINYSQFFVK